MFHKIETTERQALIINFALGVAVLAGVILLLWATGHVAEPRMQWLPAIRALNNMTWHSDIGRSIYAGFIVVMIPVLTAAGVVCAFGLTCSTGYGIAAVVKRR